MIVLSSAQPHPPFVIHDFFIETPFERRFQGLLRRAWQQRTWHIIAAVPGSGKSFGIHDLVHQSGACKEPNGVTRLPLLAIRAPKNATKELALGTALSAAFGVVPRMPWYIRRSWLVQIAASAQVENIIIDDAQDLSLEHLALLKELTDNLAAPPYGRSVGLCLVVAHTGNIMPLKEIFARPDTLWRQFRRRLDTELPFCTILGHTTIEVRDILTAFEELYRSQLPDLQLRRWAKSITTWLTHPTLDPDATGRVTMDHLTRLVISAMRQAYEQRARNVEGPVLEHIAELMVLRRDDIISIDSPDEDSNSSVQEVG
jgi:hypothetical protein